MYRILTADSRNVRKWFSGPLAETLDLLKQSGFVILTYERI